MLQRHAMLRRLEELQRHQQLKQATGHQFLPLINETPIHDPSQMFMVGNMNLVQHGVSPTVQGFPNGLYSQGQSHDLRSTGLVPQQLDVSLYGIPISSAKNNLSQYSHLQGLSQDSANGLTKGNDNQAEKPIMQSSGFSNSFLGDHCNVSSDQLCISDGALMSKQVFHGKNLSGQVPLQGFNSGVLPENFQQVNTLQRNASAQEFSGRQEQAGWPGLFPGKTTQIDPSQGLSTLDPLEQKILFDLDDNSWNASFGSNTDMGTGGFGNVLEFMDYGSSLPSIQSGSWSALMQSAVAEASSSDNRLQEEWSGLSFQNTELSTDNQPSNFVDSRKQQNGWGDNNVQSASYLSSKPQLLSNDPNMSSRFPGFQQSGIQFSMKQREGMHSDSSPESVQQSPKNAFKWLDCNTQQNQSIEGSQLVHTMSPLEDAWLGFEHSEGDAHHQGISSYNKSHQPSNKLIGRRIESSSPTGNATFNVCDNENAVNKSWTGYKNGAMSKEKDPVSDLWKIKKNSVVNSFCNSVGRLELVKSGVDNKKVEREDSQSNNFAAVPNSSTKKFDLENSQQLDYMKHADISAKIMRNKSVADEHHQLSNSPQVLAYSYEGASETYMKQQNCYQRENSNDSYRSNASQHTIPEHEVRGNMWLHDTDSQPVVGGNQKSSGQVLCQQVSQGLNSHEQGYFGQFKFVDNTSKSAVELEKGCLYDIQRNLKASEELPPRSNIGANISASFDGSVGIYGPNLTSQKSQNMLELLHKLDHAGEQSSVTNFSSTDSNPLLEVPEAETPESSMAKPFDHSSISQHFGLRLAPPSQRLPSNSFFSSQGSPQIGNSTAASPTGPIYLRNQLQTPHLSAAPVATQSPRATLSGMASRLPHFSGVTSQPNSVSPFGQQFPILEAVPVSQRSLMSGLSQQVVPSTRPPDGWANVPTQPHLSDTGTRKAPSNLFLYADSTNNSLQTTSWAPKEVHDQNSYRGTPSQEFGACSMNSQFFASGEEHPGNERSHQQISSEILDQVSDTGGLALGQESVPKSLSQSNAIGSGSLMAHPVQQDFDRAQHGGIQSPAVSARDLEAFGRSLKPSNVHPTYSLLHQVHSVKNVETDPSKRILEKNHGAGSDLNAQQITTVAGHQMMYGHNSGARDPVNNGLNVSQLNSSPTRGIKMLSFSSEVGEDQSTKGSSLPLVQDTQQEMVTPRQSFSQSHPSGDNVVLHTTEHSQISSQRAPSWFKPYGTLRNGQMLSMYGARTPQQFLPGNPFENLHMSTSMARLSATGASQVGSVWPTTGSSLSVGKQSPLCMLPLDVTGQNLTVMRLKKRKIDTSELLPWHKEVTQSSKRLQNTSMAELEWAQAINRLTEKVEAEAETVEDMQPLLRPKKRLVITTQLMQQLFRPAPAAILSADASSNYDTVAYFTAKLALGDACSLTSCSRSGSCLSSNGYDMMSEKCRTSERIGDHYFSRTVEDFTKRAKKLESELLRLDKTASVVDIRVEYQELETFSVINRFAKFHCRGQPDAAGSSSFSGTTPPVLKPFPQRYVTAIPMPRAVPEGAQCLLL